MNKCIFTGRLGKNPEVKYTPAGKCVATFSIAVKRNKEESDWVNIVAWEKTAELVGNNLTKGSNVLIESRVQVRTYDNKEGKKVYVTEFIADRVEFLDSKKDGQAPATTNADVNQFGTDVNIEEEIPF